MTVYGDCKKCGGETLNYSCVVCEGARADEAEAQLAALREEVERLRAEAETRSYVPARLQGARDARDEVRSQLTALQGWADRVEAAAAAMLRESPLPDDCRIMAVAVNGPVMSDPDSELGRKTHAALDRYDESREALRSLLASRPHTRGGRDA